MHLGDRLREERKRLGYNQADFGDLAGVTRKTQFNYESGSSSPDTHYLACIEKAGADIVYIQTGVRSAEREFQRRLDVVAHVSRQAAALGLPPEQADLLQRIGMAAETGDSTTLRRLLRPVSGQAAALLDNYERMGDDDRRALERTAAAMAGAPPKAARGPRMPKTAVVINTEYKGKRTGPQIVGTEYAGKRTGPQVVGQESKPTPKKKRKDEAS